ncbi:Pr6Pr family membrane protein [Georgenia wangjunii]|uniref:Pr6Pr family membrane protein n=1 Tax=Georgenia wangjunii TaxID=3117730 RepID=UPI003D9C077E
MLTGAVSIRYRVALLGSATSGIVLQIIQGEDPTPTYEYFTIWSAAALVLYGSNLLSRLPAAESYVRNAASAGALLSAVVYLAAIAPVNGMGSEPTTVAANAVLHLVVPVVVILLYASKYDLQFPPRAIVTTLTFPAAYLGWAILTSAVGGAPPVYVFLDVRHVGVLGVLGATLGGSIVYLLVALFLSRLTVRKSRRDGETQRRSSGATSGAS